MFFGATASLTVWMVPVLFMTIASYDPVQRWLEDKRVQENFTNNEIAHEQEEERQRQADIAAANAGGLTQITHTANRWWEIGAPLAVAGGSILTGLVCIASYCAGKPQPPVIGRASDALYNMNATRF